MSIRDPFYVQIKEALCTVHLDTDMFERLAAEIVDSKGYKTNYVGGGADNGYDFEILDKVLEPGPGVATTSNRVLENLKRNLDRNKTNCPQAAKKTFIVTSSVLTTQKRNNLKMAARGRGYIYLGASDLYEVARYIYAHPSWAQSLLGLSGQPSALSAVPRSRPLTDIPLVGREQAEDLLRRLDNDALLIGSPGSGKTALLTRLVVDGTGSFLVSSDMTAVANSIRQQQPHIVIIDDLENMITITRDLVHLRREICADFRIVVTDWEVNPEINQELGLTDSNVIKLDRLTREEIVSVIKSVGIVRPRLLVREIVDQAEGVPGLAVTLTQAALAGDYRDLFDGNHLGTLMIATVARLLRGHRQGDQAVLALGVISLAGNIGLTLEEVAGFLGKSKDELHSLLRRLNTAGVIRSDLRRITVRPPSLRRFVIRESFFNRIPVDHTPLLSIVPDIGEMVKELVLATHAGVAIPNLLDLVLESSSIDAARFYAGSGERQARQLLDAAPTLTIYVAREALHTAPEKVIPLLLDLAVGDSRELHNTPEHPIRLIKEWANSGVQGPVDSVTRKRIVVRSALSWADNGGDFDTACRLCSEVLCTIFEINELDPGAGMTMHLEWGMLPSRDIREISNLWHEVRAAIEDNGEAPWPSLLYLCSELIHPHIIGKPPEEALRESRRFGEVVIMDLGELAAGHPGVLDSLNAMRRQLGHEELYPVAEEYVALFGECEHIDWRREEQERNQLIQRLAESWAVEDPAEFSSRLNWLHSEADVAGKNIYARAQFLCRLIAERVDDPGRWLTVLSAANVPATCLLPFLEHAVLSEDENWETITIPILNNPVLEAAGVNFALRAPHMTDTFWEVLSPKLTQYHQYINILCLRKEVPLATLQRLLNHDSQDVTHATAVGMWTGGTHGDIPDELKQEWEDAVVRIDDTEYWLQEILKYNPAMAARWLRARIENNDWRALTNDKNVQVAASSLDDECRLDILRNLPEHFYFESLTKTLIGDSDEVYRQVLRDQSLDVYWSDPLKRRADETWRHLAGIALDEGHTPQQVAQASMSHSDSWWGPESGYLQGKIDELVSWLEDPDERIQQVAQLIIGWLSARKEHALAEERRNAIEGFR